MKNLNWKIAEKDFFKKNNTNQYKLDNILEALQYLGNPHKQLEEKVIHIAGTNGKGSVASYIKTILETSGYKVGVFTSPHLVQYNERIYFNGRFATDEEIENCRQEIIKKCKNFDKISYFEATTLIAIMLFAKTNLDYCVVEVGLGGRLDATNIFEKKLASVITSISFDHTDILGDTLEKIAYEKGGIIKPKVPVFTSNTNPQVIKILQQIADKNNTSLFCQERDYSLDTTLQPSLLGQHQIINANLAMVVCRYLKVSTDNILKGISNTKWAGRLQEIELKDIDNKKYNIDKIYIDGGHNEDGIKVLCEFIKTQKQKNQKSNIVGVFAVLKRKNYKNFFPILNSAGLDKLLFYNVPVGVNDFVSSDELNTLAKNTNITTDVINNFIDLRQHLNNQKENFVFIFGSLYFVGYVLENFVKSKPY